MPVKKLPSRIFVCAVTITQISICLIRGQLFIPYLLNRAREVHWWLALDFLSPVHRPTRCRAILFFGLSQVSQNGNVPCVSISVQVFQVVQFVTCHDDICKLRVPSRWRTANVNATSQTAKFQMDSPPICLRC